jgi:ATP-dependent protease ClpP protease subunit
MNSGALEANVVGHQGQQVAVIKLYGNLGWPSALQSRNVMKLLNGLGDYDILYAILDSAGGSPVEAWLIYDFLKKNQTPRLGSLVLIPAECSGDAILIALAFSQILMQPGAHIEFRPILLPRLAAGQRVTRLLSRLVAERAGCRVEDVLGWMDKNKKLSAQECLERSLCDAIV